MARSYTAGEVRARDIVPESAKERLGWESAIARRAELKKFLKENPSGIPKNERDDPSSDYNLQKAEKTIQKAANEVAYVWDKYGRLVSISGDGRESSVNVNAFREQMLGGTLTHNHPVNSAALSVGDILSHLQTGLKVTRAIDVNGNVTELTYEGELPYENLNSLQSNAVIIKSINQEAFAKVFGDAWTEEIKAAAKANKDEFEKAGGWNEIYGKSLPEDANPYMREFILKHGYEKAGEVTMKWVAEKLKPLGFKYKYNGKEI